MKTFTFVYINNTVAETARKLNKVSEWNVLAAPVRLMLSMC